MSEKAKMSVSFGLGKASAAHGANVEHNNREFIPDNVDPIRIADNITYVKQNIRAAYDELFGEAITDYNSKQKRNDRKINDYYQHISEGGREEAFYEIVVQFSDSEYAPVGSWEGELSRRMLTEYMQEFQNRNPNLHVFNAVLHADEASYHLHINVIPFYTEPRQRGLPKGVSMKAALIQQGFVPQGKNSNQLALWQNSEREHMEQLLSGWGMERDVKNANYEHMEVDEYKISQDEKKLPPLSRRKAISPEQLAENNVRKLTEENDLLKIENEKLTIEISSPWKSFYFSDSAKQSFVQQQLDRFSIPYRENDSGFEAQECYVSEIRKIEKQYKTDTTSQRDKLRNTIDRYILNSKNFDVVLERLEKSGCEVKRGKYVAVKPPDSKQFIRLKSLGEHYSESAIEFRFVHKSKFEQEVESNLKSAKEKQPDSFETMLYAATKTYMFTVMKGNLPMQKRNKKKPFTWANDADLDKLSELNKKINAGVTLDSLRNEFKTIEKRLPDNDEKFADLQKELQLYTKLNNAANQCYGFGDTDHNMLDFLEANRITPQNYRQINTVIIDINEEMSVLSADRAKLKDISETINTFEQVLNSTYVYNLIQEEKERREWRSKNEPNSVESVVDKPVEVVPPSKADVINNDKTAPVSQGRVVHKPKPKIR